MVRYNSVRKEVESISKDAQLLAVSKTKPYSDILEAYNEGARVFGENRVQEIEAKFPIPRPDGMKVYLIGQLQSNKVRKAVALVDRIESVDSLKLISLIEKEAARIGKTIEVLLEFNSSGEEQKSGFRSEEELLEGARLCSESEHISFMGIMTVGPLGFDRDKNIKAFERTKALFDRLKAEYGISVLSMGMSADWQDALLCGSTEVRIGSAIFGARN